MFEVKYRLEYDGLDGLPLTGQKFRLDLLEDNWSGGITEVCGTEDPVIINLNDLDMYSGAIGSGMTISLNSATEMQFLDLYTVDLKKYKIKLYLNNDLIWVGWLDPEMYEETYSEYRNYPIQFTANDGIALLDRIKYINPTTTARYEGIDTAYNVITRCLALTELEYNALYIVTNKQLVEKDDTLVPIIEEETVLHQLLVHQGNYYDELGDPMTLKETVNSILQSLGLQMRLNPKDASLYIYDVNTLAESSDMIVKEYSTTDWSYVAFTTVPHIANIYDIRYDMDYTGTGQSFTFTDPVNNLQLNYSKYSIGKIFDIPLEQDKFCGYEDCPEYMFELIYDNTADCDSVFWSEWFYQDLDIDYEILDTTSAYFIKKNKGDSVRGILAEGEELYIKSTNLVNDTSGDSLFKTTAYTPYVLGNNLLSTPGHPLDPKPYGDFYHAYLSVDFSVYFRISECYEGYTPIDIADHQLKLKVSIGSFEYIANVDLVGDSTGTTVKSDTWLSPSSRTRGGYVKGVLIPIGYITDDTAPTVEGRVTVEVLKEMTVDTQVLDIRYKDFKCNLIINLLTGEPEDSEDVVITSDVNKLAKEEGKTIELRHGTYDNNDIQRGSFMRPAPRDGYFYADRIYTKVLDDSLDPVYYTFENSVLNTVISNYNEPRIEIDNVVFDNKTIANPVLNLFTDAEQFTSDRLMQCYGAEWSTYNNTFSTKLREVNKDVFNVIEDESN